MRVTITYNNNSELTLIFDCGELFSINRTDTATTSPTSSPRSCATRSASVIAETRLGSVTPIKPRVCHPNSYRY